MTATATTMHEGVAVERRRLPSLEAADRFARQWCAQTGGECWVRDEYRIRRYFLDEAGNCRFKIEGS